jgi:hypothetical protein
MSYTGKIDFKEGKNSAIFRLGGFNNIEDLSNIQ